MAKTRVEYDTEAEALAFMAGIEFIDNDHVITEGPEIELDNAGNDIYIVYVEEFS
jgi:hypothetical protein